MVSLCLPSQAGLKQYASTTGSLTKAPLASESLLGLQAYGRQVRCQGPLPLYSNGCTVTWSLSSRRLCTHLVSVWYRCENGLQWWSSESLKGMPSSCFPPEHAGNWNSGPCACEACSPPLSPSSARDGLTWRQWSDIFLEKRIRIQQPL